MPKYTTPEGVSVTCSEQQAEYLGYTKAAPKNASAKKAPAKKAGAKESDSED